MSIILILTVCILIGHFFYSQGSIAKKNQVILKSEWAPNCKHTENALIQITGFLNNIKKNTDDEYLLESAKNILREIDQYRVQFDGIIRNGQKIIFCNFFYKDDDWDIDWQETLVEVLDGGYWYWQIEYDVETGKCINFTVNGVA
ncbi:hypothetical protein JW935_06290 [candidate division KSB1 bacterium]|nr:hypothetical protein [candidate division KSB1 bacterium]